MKAELLNKILRKNIIWGEIKFKEEEFKRIQKQIAELEKAKSNLLTRVRDLLEESQRITEWIDERSL